MMNNKSFFLVFSLLFLLLLITFIINISLGSVHITFDEIINILLNNPVKKSSWKYIILNYRLPKAITTMICGIGLSITGLIMQTFFRNPLAGPFVLGLSSGASLGVALMILGSSFLPAFTTLFIQSPYGIVLASSAGSFIVLISILSFAKKVNDATSLLIIGLMFSSFTSAIVGILTYFSSAEELQKFTLWSMGNLGGLSWHSIYLLVTCVVIGLLITIGVIKPLNSLLLGEQYAKSMGLNISKTRLLVVFSTSILAGSITAFVGPIAFIGLAVPHITKLIFKTSNHLILFIGCFLLGAILLLLCDTIAQVPNSDIILPINAITSLFGAPIVIWLLMQKKKSL